MNTNRKLSMLATLIFSAISFSQTTQPTNAISTGSYLGTSNNFDVIFKRSNTAAGLIGTNKLALGLNSSAVNESVSIGASAGQYSSGGGSHPRNTYVGAGSGAGTLSVPNTGKDNAYFGSGAGNNNSSGAENVFVGSAAGEMNNSGFANVMVGYRSGSSNLGGTSNVYLGSMSGLNATTSSGNVFIGALSGQNELGSNLLYIENSDSSTPLIWGNFATSSRQVKLNGKTGIGMGLESFPTNALYTNYKLFVRGGILSDEVRVRTTWADYVFLDGYELASLNDVEKYIKTHGHLKNVPSAKQIEEAGIEIGQMARIQQEKIEELTLYLIQQKKEMDELKAQIQTLLERK